MTSRDRGLAAFRAGQYRKAADAFRLACDSNQGDPAASSTPASVFAFGADPQRASTSARLSSFSRESST